MITKKPWFVAKRYGWGWMPATWQGWGILLVFVVVIYADLHRIDVQSHSVSDTLIAFLPHVIVWSAILVGVCYLTGEKPYWRWGK